MNVIGQDVRFALRMLRKSPGLSTIAILTFALGIGVNVSIFSVVDAIALRPLAVRDADRIVRIFNQDPAHPERGIASSWIEAEAMRAEARGFAAVTAVDRRAVMVKEDDETRMLLTNVVAENYFDVFRITPQAGRVFSAADSATTSQPVVVLSYDYWQRRYNADPAIVGQTIVATDVACTVLGILPRSFRGGLYFLLGCIGFAKGNVVTDTAAEQSGLLQNDPDLRAQRVKLHIAQVVIVNSDPALARIIEARQ